MIDEAFSEYLALRGWHKNAAAMSSLYREAQATREYRKKKFLKKIFRHSGPFICQKNWQQLSIYDRSYDSENFRAFLNSLDELLDSKACAIIKRGNTATVGVIKMDDGHALVIKRYNIKGFWHAIRRALRHTRAAVSWENAHLLNFYEINTLAPVALIEKRFGPLRRTSYFISSYLEGIDCGSYFGGNAALTSEQKEMAGRISALISNLAEVNISHGDMKASNIIISSKQPMLLDLDALRQHRLKIIHKRAFARDMQRFLRNWEMLSPAYNLFESSLLKPLKKPGTRS
jgi:tRNA A-37 threonylcarbamoyl transferase component Bud32